VAAVTVTPIITAERMTRFSGTELEDLCEASAEAINSGGGFGWVKTPKRHLLESYWKGVVLVPDRHLLVAKLDGTIAGSIQLVRPPRNAESQAHQALLTGLFVAPWAHGHGLGRRLVRAAEAEAMELGVVILNLDVREAQTHAIRLFEDSGFQRWGTHPAYARVDGGLVRGFFYYKQLDPTGAPP
jgi:ribosomal protein S18 acetylase RimI-like enzyme